ncbi:hypothetical protein DTO169E5_8352 [Paecilomyces variotii]|nr:hypothetical protein DTO169E5_8352 [Paecilomyces variotii]
MRRALLILGSWQGRRGPNTQARRRERRRQQREQAQQQQQQQHHHHHHYQEQQLIQPLSQGQGSQTWEDMMDH